MTANDEEEMAEAGQVEKGVMAKDEEEMAEAREVEKRRMHQCSECGKSYKHEHKLKHH